MTTEGSGRLPGGLAPSTAVSWPASGLTLSEIAGLVLEAAVPRFADAVAVFALEGLLVGGEPDGRTVGEQVIVRRLGSGYARAGHPVADSAAARLAPSAAAPGTRAKAVPSHLLYGGYRRFISSHRCIRSRTSLAVTTAEPSSSPASAHRPGNASSCEIRRHWQLST